MSYKPKIITPDDVRAFITPFLEHTTLSDADILPKIEAVETYLSEVWYEGDYPSKGRVPAILLTSSKIINETSIETEKYREVSKIADITFAGVSDIYKNAKTWEEMAYEILKSQSNIFKVSQVNKI